MYLLDTNVISEIRKARAGKADRNVAAWAAAVAVADLFVSVVAIQEIEIGVLLAERRDPRQGRLLRAWLDVHVLGAFADRILPVDLSVARRSARLHVAHDASGARCTHRRDRADPWNDGRNAQRGRLLADRRSDHQSMGRCCGHPDLIPLGSRRVTQTIGR